MNKAKRKRKQVVYVHNKHFGAFALQR